MTSPLLDPTDALSTAELLDALGNPDDPPRRPPPAGASGAEPVNAPSPLPVPICLLDAPAPQPLEWLVQGLFLHREIGILGATGGSYKSTLLLAIAGAVAGGYPVFGKFATDPTGKPVLFVSEEDGLDVIVNRVEALIQGAGWDREAVLGNLHLLALEGARLNDLAWQLHLRECAEQLEAHLICLDPLADLLGDGEAERDPDRARGVVQFWRRLAADGAAILVAHHLTKPKEGYGHLDRIRGAGSWGNAARAVYGIEVDGDSLRLTCSKSNRVRKPEPIEIRMAIETDPANEASWTSASFTAAGWILPTPSHLNGAERDALAALERHPEGLSWSKWEKTSGLKPQRLSEAMAALTRRDLVRAVATERKHRGRPVSEYAITGKGIAALYSATPANSGPTPPELAELDTESQLRQLRSNSGGLAGQATPLLRPPLRGRECGGPGVGDSNSGNGSGVAAAGPGLEDLPPDWLPLGGDDVE